MFVFVVDIIINFSLRAQSSLSAIMLTTFMVKGGLTIGQMEHVSWEGLPTTGAPGRTDFLRQREFVEGPIAHTGHDEHD